MTDCSQLQPKHCFCDPDEQSREREGCLFCQRRGGYFFKEGYLSWKGCQAGVGCLLGSGGGGCWRRDGERYRPQNSTRQGVREGQSLGKEGTAGGVERGGKERETEE